MIKLHLGDCLDQLKGIPDDSIDAVVTDPPYGLSAPPDIAVVLQAWLAGEAYEHTGAGFMGAAWDSFVPGPRVWREVFRVLKPGGHAVVFAGSRTVDLMGIAVRLGGFEVRDCGQWAYWSGFPKSRNLSIDMEMDRLAGAEREVVGHRAKLDSFGPSAGNHVYGGGPDHGGRQAITAPATDNARKWSGFGTAVKPAVEPWLLLRKPISESSIARNVLRWGVGGLNIAACRFAPGDPMWPGPQDGDAGWCGDAAGGATWNEENSGLCKAGEPRLTSRRFPANLIHCPKASRKERELGCHQGLPTKTGAEATGSKEGQARLDSPRTGAGRTADEIRNWHSTVKPVKLMQWLVRLVTPPGGVVLDPFMGSGTTGMAAAGQGFDFIGMELDPGHLRIARARIAYSAPGHDIDAPTEATAGNAEPNQTRMF